MSMDSSKSPRGSCGTKSLAIQGVDEFRSIVIDSCFERALTLHGLNTVSLPPSSAVCKAISRREDDFCALTLVLPTSPSKTTVEIGGGTDRSTKIVSGD